MGYRVGLMWLNAAVVCLRDALRVQLFAGNGDGRPHNVAAVSLADANQLPLPTL